jgi:hypothetical protein
MLGTNFTARKNLPDAAQCMQRLSDNEVLEQFPRAVRDRVLRALYIKTLHNVYLFKTPHIRANPAFVSNLLSLGQIDTYSSNVAVLEANSQVHDFMILLDGEMRVRRCRI